MLQPSVFLGSVLRASAAIDTRTGLACVVAAVFLSLATAAPAQSVLYVDDDAPAGGDGSSWTAAFRYLQDALDAARNSGGAVTEIRVAQGTYHPDQGQSVPPGEPETHFSLVNGVALMGGYAGQGTPNPDERDLEAHQTSVLGTLSATDLDRLTRVDGLLSPIGGIGGTNSHVLVDRVSSIGISFIDSQEVTINRSAFNSALFIRCPSVTINGCKVEMKEFWRCVQANSSSLTITGTTITGRGTEYPLSSFAGVYCFGGDLTMSECVVSQFAREGSVGRGGGGIECVDVAVSIQNSVIHDNLLVPQTFHPDTEGGGGIFCNGGDVLIDGCTIINNHAPKGGGISLRQVHSAIIRNSTISHNRMDHILIPLGAQSEDDGGGIYCRHHSIVLDTCRISGNVASGMGGGAYLWATDAVVKNCIFSGNQSGIGGYPGDGAGLYLFSYGGILPVVTNCAFVRNQLQINGSGTSSIGRRGGGMFSSAPTTISNCVFWNNSAAFGHEIALDSGTSEIEYCLVQGGPAEVYTGSTTLNWGEGNLDEDPLFAALGRWDDSSTPGFTLDDKWIDGDYHLQHGSPCIDAGTNTPAGDAAMLPPTDLDGVPRPQDGDDDNEAIADIGAYESSLTIPVIDWSPAVLEANVTEADPDPAPMVLSIRNVGGGVLNWQITETCDWLDASPAIGDSTGEAEEVCLMVDTSGLGHGDHTCILTLSDPQATNDPQEVVVTLHVNATLHVPADYPTIQAAIDAAVKGDVVLVADGTYTGDGNRNINFSAKAITVRSQNGPAVTIVDCQGSSEAPQSGFQFYRGEGRDSVLDGFTITRAYSSLPGGAIECRGSQPTVRNCVVVANTSPRGSAAHLYVSAPHINGCTFRGNVTSYSGSIESDSSYATFDDCIFLDDSLVAGAHIGGAGGHVTVINSTFSRLSPNGAGFDVFSGYGRLTLLNSIAWPNGRIVFRNQSRPTEHTIAWCNIRNGQSAIEAGTNNIVNWGPGNISADPLFVSALNGDFRLLPGSPCIDAGSNAAVPIGAATDLDGRPRLMDDPATPDTGQGTPPIVDMGPYEYAPPPPPDFNDDGAVNALDFEHFDDCATGPANGPPADGCADTDLDRDNDVDQCDFGLLQPWLGWLEPEVMQARTD